MGAAGSPYAAFQRAMKARNVTLALAEARDLPRVSLQDALALTLLVAEKEPRLFERAAVRFAARYLGERSPVLVEAQLVLTALAASASNNSRPAAAALLERLVRGSEPRRD